MQSRAKNLGVGLGLRSPYFAHILENRPAIPWFEAISENFMGIGEAAGGRAIQILEQIRQHYPVVFHGVSMSIGSMDPLDESYLKRLKELVDRFDPMWISDHLCWTGVQGENLHDLLPLPYTEEAIVHLSERIQRVQEFMGRRLVLENVSSYVTFSHSEMTEWEFISEISRRTDCGILLDVNNVYVSSFNHGFDPIHFLKGIPKERVQQMHLAGYSDQGKYLLDTHDHPVTQPVWDLYRKAFEIFGPVPTLIEWDAGFPDFDTLNRERLKAEEIAK